jgi:AraC-like DNA-binding protein
MLLIVPMDPFAALFAHVTPKARTFFTGQLCGTAQFTDEGHLHLLTAGALTLVQTGQGDIQIDEPTLLFFPRGRAHNFTASQERGADLVCATVELGGAEGNPIGQGLPELVVLPLASHRALAPVCELLLDEAFSQRSGRQAALDRLFDYLLILIVRHVVESGRVATGVLAGLADPRLAKALTAMHEAPKTSWTLDELAGIAGMSRTRFAEHFRTRVGQTPINYLTRLAHDGCIPASRKGQVRKKRGAPGRLPECRCLLSRVQPDNRTGAAQFQSPKSETQVFEQRPDALMAP